MEVETSLLLGVLFLLIFLALTFFGYLCYSGLLSEIVIGTKSNPVDKLTVAYKFARGPYKNASDLYTEVHTLTPNLRCIGIYYDCPDEVVPQRLRYVVGAILSEGDGEVNEEEKNLLMEKGYKVTTFPSVSHAVITSFPFVNTFSVFIAIVKVYPRINHYITERSLSAHPMMEIYEKGLIFFVAPLARQDEYYVPESLEEDEDAEDSVVSTAQSDGDDSVVTDTEPTHQGTDYVEEDPDETTGTEEDDDEESIHSDSTTGTEGPTDSDKEEEPRESPQDGAQPAELSLEPEPTQLSESPKEVGEGAQPISDVHEGTEQVEFVEDSHDGKKSLTSETRGTESTTLETDAEVIYPSEEKGKSSAAAVGADTSEEEPSQSPEDVPHTQQGKSEDAEGRSSEQGDDDSSASSSFEELTLDAAESS